MLFAQAAAETNWGAFVGLVVNAGFAGLVGWYLLTKALPKLQESFLSSLAAERKDFLAEVKEVRDLAKGDDAIRRADHKATLDAVLAHCEREAARQTEVVKNSVAEVAKVTEATRHRLQEVIDSQRELRERLAERTRT